MGTESKGHDVATASSKRPQTVVADCLGRMRLTMEEPPSWEESESLD